MADSQQVIDELWEDIEDLKAQIDQMREEYDFFQDDEEEDEKENIEVPAAGRTNWERGVTNSIEKSPDENETITETVEIPVAGRSNKGGTTIEREVPVARGYEEVAEGMGELYGHLAQASQKEVERRRKARGNRFNDGFLQNHHDDDEELAVPAGGHSNWEEYRKEDE